MRVMQVVYSLAAGGAELFVVDLARAMKRQGAEVHVITIYQSDDPLRPVLEQHLAKAGVGHTNLGKPAARMSVTAALRYWKVIRRFRPDIVHSHSVVPTWLNGCLTPLACPSARRVCTLHCVDERFLRTFPANVVKPWNRFHRIICVSDAVRKETEDVPNKSVIYVARDLAQFVHPVEDRARWREELSIEPDEIVFLHIGSMRGAQKNHEALVEAFQMLPTGAKARLLLLGDGKLRKQLEAQSVKATAKRILFLGIQQDVARYYALADVFVLPSLWEGRPLVAMEALASGLPCLFTPIPELVEVGRAISGIHYCSGTTARDIHAGLLHCLTSPEVVHWRRVDAERQRIAVDMGIDACVLAHWQKAGYDQLPHVPGP